MVAAIWDNNELREKVLEYGWASSYDVRLCEKYFLYVVQVWTVLEHSSLTQTVPLSVDSDHICQTWPALPRHISHWVCSLDLLPKMKLETSCSIDFLGLWVGGRGLYYLIHWVRTFMDFLITIIMRNVKICPKYTCWTLIWVCAPWLRSVTFLYSTTDI